MDGRRWFVISMLFHLKKKKKKTSLFWGARACVSICLFHEAYQVLILQVEVSLPPVSFFPLTFIFHLTKLFVIDMMEDQNHVLIQVNKRKGKPKRRLKMPSPPPPPPPPPASPLPQLQPTYEEGDPLYQCVLQEELNKTNIPNFQEWHKRPRSLYVGQSQLHLNNKENIFATPFAKIQVPRGFMTPIEVILFSTRMFFLYILCNDKLLQQLALMKNFQLGCWCRPNRPIVTIVSSIWNARCHCDVLRMIMDMFEDPSKEIYYKITSFVMPRVLEDGYYSDIQDYKDRIDLLGSASYLLDDEVLSKVKGLTDRDWALTNCKIHLGYTPCMCYRHRKMMYDIGLMNRNSLAGYVVPINKDYFYINDFRERSSRERVLWVAKQMIHNLVTIIGNDRCREQVAAYQKSCEKLKAYNERTNARLENKADSVWMTIENHYDPAVDPGDAGFDNAIAYMRTIQYVFP